MFVDPELTISGNLHSRLSTMGYRRSGFHVYRPDCGECRACVSTRVIVDRFRYKRRHQKILNRNADLQVRRVESLGDDECYRMYHHYITERHRDGDMYPPSKEQYESFINTKVDGTEFYKFYAGRSLTAVSIVDYLDHGLSAVYTFFDPLQSRRSLGTHAILWQIERARTLGLPYVYLGYWVKGCRKMNYKSSFRPLEMLVAGKWIVVN